MDAIITLSSEQLVTIVVTIVAALLGGVLYAHFLKEGDSLKMMSLKLASSATIATLAIGVVFTPIKLILEAPLRKWGHPASTLTGCWVQQIQSAERPISLARLDFDRNGNLFFQGTAYSSRLEERAHWKSKSVSVDPSTATVRYQSSGFLWDASPSPVYEVQNFGYFEAILSPDGNHVATGLFIDELHREPTVHTYQSWKVDCPASGLELTLLESFQAEPLSNTAPS